MHTCKGEVRGKGKALCTLVGSGVPVREDSYIWPSENKMGESIPFIIAFISTVLPPGAHLLLGGQRASIQVGLKCGLIH